MMESTFALEEKNWYAVYTIVRHEKSAGNALLEKGIETFLPLRKITSRWKDRWKRIQVPLFPGYLFIQMARGPREILNVLKTRGVIRVLGAGEDPAPVPGEQIHALKTLMESSLAYDPVEEYRPGKEACVFNGPLKGIHGTIVERRGAFRLIIAVDMIHRAVAVEVDLRDIHLLS